MAIDIDLGQQAVADHHAAAANGVEYARRIDRLDAAILAADVGAGLADDVARDVVGVARSDRRQRQAAIERGHPVADQGHAVSQHGAGVHHLHRVGGRRPAVEILASDADVPGGIERAEAAVHVAAVVQDDHGLRRRAGDRLGEPRPVGRSVVDGWPVRRQREHVEVAERRRRHLAAEDGREVAAHPDRDGPPLEVDAGVVLRRYRQLDALAGQRQHPLVDGGIAVPREGAGVDVRVHGHPAARVDLAADREAPRRRLPAGHLDLGAIHAVFEAAPGVDHVAASRECQPGGARARVDDARPHRQRGVAGGAEHHQRAAFVGHRDAARDGQSRRRFVHRDRQGGFGQHLAARSRDQPDLADQHVIRSRAVTIDPQLVAAGRQAARRDGPVGNRLRLVGRQAGDLRAIDPDAPCRLHVAVTNPQGVFDGVGRRLEAQHQRRPFGRGGEVAPLTGRADAQVVHPVGQHAVGRRPALQQDERREQPECGRPGGNHRRYDSGDSGAGSTAAVSNSAVGWGAEAP